jgi:DNA ligase-1
MPEVVIEVAFDAIQKSARHKSGYALRFPRIVRLRPDKPPEEANTLEDVRRLHEGTSR